MRTRAKALTVAVAMVTTFAILPTLGAAAAEPLEDGSYDVAVGESTYTVGVVDGVPVVDEAEGVAFAFVYDEATGRVLDEFDVSVDGVAYDVVVADDGSVTVTAAEADGGADDGTAEDTTGSDPEGTEGDGTATDGTGGSDVVDETDETDETDGTDGSDVVEEDGTEELEESDEVEDDGDAAHGALVSTVAECAPRGRDAREAGLPNHGFFVRAAAHGEDVEFEADGETHVAALSTQEGADAFCALAADLMTADAAEQATEDEPADQVTGEQPTDDVADEEPAAQTAEAREDEPKDRGNAKERGNAKDRSNAAKRGKGRAGAPGQQGRGD